MRTIGTLPGERLAGLSADLFHKLQNGNITLDQLALFTQHKNPFALERNEYGHIIVNVTGLDLTGAQEIERLEAAGYCLESRLKTCLLSQEKDSYDKNHRLAAGQQYRLALVTGEEIERSGDCGTDALRKLGMKKYGYGKPLAGHLLRVFESISNMQIEEKGEILYIASLHETIQESSGDPVVFIIDRVNGYLDMDTRFVGSNRQWNPDVLFAFPVVSS